MPLVASDTQDISVNVEDNNAEDIAIVERPGKNTFGFFTESNNIGYINWIFFLDGDGNVGRRFEVGSENTVQVAEYEDGLVVFPTSEEDYESDPPTVYRPDGSKFTLDADQWDSLEPQYQIGSSGILQIFSEDNVTGFEDITSARLASGRRVEVFTASDDDGSDDDNDGNDADDDGLGVFVQLYGVRGNKIGDAIRVNENTLENQDDPEITLLGGDKFLVTYADGEVDPVLFKGRVYESISSLDGAIRADAGNDTLRGDGGDDRTDIFLYDTARGDDLGRDRILDFGRNDVLVTTTKISDANGDDIITFGRDKRLDLEDGSGDAVAELSIAGTRAIEFDGQVSSDGVTYYVYSLVGSDAGLTDLTF